MVLVVVCLQGIVYGVTNAGRVCLYSSSELGSVSTWSACVVAAAHAKLSGCAFVRVFPRQKPFMHNHVLEGSPDTEWTGMVFSDDDRFIALSCSRGVILVDAFELHEVLLVKLDSPGPRECCWWSLNRGRGCCTGDANACRSHCCMTTPCLPSTEATTRLLKTALSSVQVPIA